MRRIAHVLAILMVLSLPVAAHAEKLPTDEGLRVTVTPDATRMKVGQVVDLALRYTDDDAVLAEADLSVESVGGSGMASDGSCATPVERHPNSGGVVLRVAFTKPGRYLVRGFVATSACHGEVTGMGHERVTVTRTITVTR